MRLALASLLILHATASFADTFTLPSAPSAVTVYADAAKVTRETSIAIPAGRHTIILPGLPPSLEPDLMRIGIEGAMLGTTQFRRDAVLPAPAQDSTEIEAARQLVKTATANLQALDDQIAKGRLAITAARARVTFLADLGSNEGLPADASSLRALARMIGEETQAAQADALDAEIAVRLLDEDRNDLEEALKDANAALAALRPVQQPGAQLSLTVDAPQAGDVILNLTYFVGAAWQPVYDVYLTGDTLEIKRGAQVSQWSDENWTDVHLTLSTYTLQQQSAPQDVFPRPVTITDKSDEMAKTLRRGAAADLALSPMMEAPVIAEQEVTASFDGPGVKYSVTSPVSVARDVDAVRIALDTLNFPANRTARAAPQFDQTAFLMASFTNGTQEPLLASRQASLYLDNTLIGQTFLELVPAGAETELPFGPIEDLRLNHVVVNETEGDRGIISRSNARKEVTRIDVHNIGDTDWLVEVRAAVPYAVQEDLQVDWRATPQPDDVDVEDKRGVLQWNLSAPAQKKASIEVETTLTWPDGKILR